MEYYCRDVLFYLDNHFEKVEDFKEERWGKIRQHISECKSCRKKYICKKHQRNIDNYLFSKKRDHRQRELENDEIIEASKHIKEGCRSCEKHYREALNRKRQTSA